MICMRVASLAEEPRSRMVRGGRLEQENENQGAWQPSIPKILVLCLGGKGGKSDKGGGIGWRSARGAA